MQMNNLIWLQHIKNVGPDYANEQFNLVTTYKKRRARFIVASADLSARRVLPINRRWPR